MLQVVWLGFMAYQLLLFFNVKSCLYVLDICIY